MMWIANSKQIRALSRLAWGLGLFLAGCLSVDERKAYSGMEREIEKRNPAVHSWVAYPAEAAELLTGELTADNAVRIALANNPRVQRAYGKLGMAAARRLQSALLHNPQTDFSLRRPESDWDSGDGQIIEVAAEIDALHGFSCLLKVAWGVPNTGR